MLMPQLRRLLSAHLPRRRRRVVAFVAATWPRRRCVDLDFEPITSEHIRPHGSNAARQIKSDLYTYMETSQVTLATANTRQ